jgi:hypothetical protein
VTPSRPDRGATPTSDPLSRVEALLAKAAVDPPDASGGTLREALAALDAAGGDPALEPPRAAAYRAEALRRLGRLPEAAAAYAAALEADLDDGQALWEGLIELSEALCGHEQVLRLVARARVKHPGRAWQWDPIAVQAQRRIDLEATAPLPPAALSVLRAEVRRRLADDPCRHDDDRRPVTAQAAAALGHDPVRVLEFLSALGACGCDCQVPAVRGPREPV